jgi:predicted nucleotidyltransferase
VRTLAAVLILLCAAGAARAETLITSLSNHRVLINSNYTGTSIAVFGSIERDAQTVSRGTGYDVVVTTRGPQQFLTVREKEKLGLLSSRPLDEMTSPQLRLRQKVGLRAIIDAPEFTMDRAAVDDPFREALYRLKAQEGLYLEDERGVTFLTPSLFRASIPLPATAPPGDYEVEVALFAGTVILARTTTHFELVKTGFEQQVGEVARDWSALYGIATALMAIFFGWLANMIFRRD